MIKKLIIIALLILPACSYEPININTTSEAKKFSNIELKGDIELAEKIKSAINVKEIEFNDALENLLIEVNYNKTSTSKDLKGQSSTFKSTIIVKLSIFKNDKIINVDNYKEEFNFERNNSQYLQSVYEQNIKEDLTDRIIKKINLSLNFNDR
jgi:hypothetical protein